MSIYATLWALKFPSTGREYVGCDWVTVLAQAVPAHIGMEGIDHYSDFLPPTVDPDGDNHRAVVFVRAGAKKETARSPQEYVAPLLMLTGAQYRSYSFEQLYDEICSALVAGRWRCTDIGTRVIAAISLEPRNMVQQNTDACGATTTAKSMSTDPRDLIGPPYKVVEYVFR
jgi:hypothetical protein